MVRKIAWGITGAGHFLTETVNYLSRIEADIFLSKAAEEVLKMYKIDIKKTGAHVYYDKAASSPAVGRIYLEKYSAVVIAPATSNTVAKCRYGISDGLVTNLFAHAGKCRVPVILLPTDSSLNKIESNSPKGKVTLYPRNLDVENVNFLSRLSNVQIVKDMEELQECIKQYL